MKRIRILLADDHFMVSAGFQKLLEPEYEVEGVVEDGRAVLKDAALQQLHMPRCTHESRGYTELSGIESEISHSATPETRGRSDSGGRWHRTDTLGCAKRINAFLHL